jgi:hypothetical protein
MYRLNIFIVVNVVFILIYCVNLAIHCIISHIILHYGNFKIGHNVIKSPLFFFALQQCIVEVPIFVGTSNSSMAGSKFTNLVFKIHYS